MIKKELALKKMEKAIKIYDKDYKGNVILFVYKGENGQLSTFEPHFNDYNFLHFTGAQTKLKAKDFYTALLENKLSLNDFEIVSKTALKLQVIEQLEHLLNGPSIIGFSNGYIYLEKNPDIVIGNTKKIVLGFSLDRKPLTLLNEDIRKCVKRNLKTLVVLRKKASDKKYKEILFLDKETEKEILKKLPQIYLEKIEV